MAWATAFHLDSCSGLICSEVFSVWMRCSTVSGLLLVAAAAAGGFLSSGALVWAMAEPSDPAISAEPASEAMASERPKGANSLVMRVSSVGCGHLRPQRAG